MSSDFYREVILDHYKNPRNFGKLTEPDASFKDSNPLCGDVVEMQLRIKEGAIKEIRFNGQGCAISRASASMLTEYVEGKALEEVKEIGKDIVVEMLGVDYLGPSRIKCALLPLKVLKMAIYSYLGEKAKEGEDYYEQA